MPCLSRREAYAPVIESFGREILDDAGRIDRKRLAAIVFNDTGKLQLLNSFVHPAWSSARMRGCSKWKTPIRRLSRWSSAILIETAATGAFTSWCWRCAAKRSRLSGHGAGRDAARAGDRTIARQMPLEEKESLQIT